MVTHYDFFMLFPDLADHIRLHGRRILITDFAGSVHTFVRKAAAISFLTHLRFSRSRA